MQGLHNRNAHAPAQVAQQAVKGGARIAQLRGQSGKSHGRQGHEGKTNAHALNQARNHQGGGAHVQVELHHLVERTGHQGKAPKHDGAQVKVVHQPTHHDHGQHGAQASWCGDDARQDHRVAHQGLQETGQQGHDPIKHDAHDEGKQAADEKIAILQQGPVEKRHALHGEGVDGKKGKSNQCPRRLQSDFRGGEPIEQFTPVQKKLQQANRQAHADKTENIQFLVVRATLWQITHDAPQGNQSHRQVDVEDQPPVKIFGQPTAQHGPQNRAHHDACPPHGHGLTHFFARVDVQQNRLRQGHQGRSKHPLEQTGHDNFPQRTSHAAQGRSHGEADHRHNENPASTHHLTKPARQRQGDGRGHDVGGQDPGDLVLRGLQAALHVRQSHIGDGGVQGLDDGGQHDRHRDHAFVRKIGRTQMRGLLCMLEYVSTSVICLITLSQSMS